MSGGIAHEINNPLTVISGRAAQTLKRIENNEFDKDMVVKNLEKIVNSSDRISNIIRALKNFSRNENHHPMELVNLSDLINDMLFLCENKINNDEALLEVAPIPKVILKCHAYQIVQILINLINNSFDATSSLPSKWIKLTFEVSETRIKIRVMDSGNGIKKELKKKVFEPFFTSKPLHYGTGLGLSISKKIALFHKGDLSIDEETKNTCFVLTLPLAGPKK